MDFQNLFQNRKCGKKIRCFYVCKYFNIVRIDAFVGLFCRCDSLVGLVYRS